MLNFTDMRTEQRSGTLNVNGVSIFSDVAVDLDPLSDYLVDLRFKVREGAVQTAMRMKVYHADFITYEGQEAESIRMTDGKTNSARVRVRTGKKSGLLSAFNEYLHSYHDHATPAYEYMTGNAGIIMEEDGESIHFRCNNRDPREQFAFEDVIGTLTVSKVVPEVYTPG